MDKSKLIESYWRIAVKALSQNDHAIALKYANTLAAMMAEVHDTIGLGSTCELLGDVYFEKKDYFQAIEEYQKMKAFAEYNTYGPEGSPQFMLSKAIAYVKLAECYKQLKDYRMALIKLKKMLQLAWFLRKTEWELLVYDHIGIIYFYLGDLDRARFYNRRMWNGTSEDPNSEILHQSNERCRVRVAKKQAFVRDGMDSTQVQGYDSSDDEAQLPSPKSGSSKVDFGYRMNKAESQRVLPSLKPSFSTDKVMCSVRPFIMLSHVPPLEPVNCMLVGTQGRMTRPKHARRTRTVDR